MAASPSWGNPDGSALFARAETKTSAVQTIEWDVLRPPGALEFENPYEGMTEEQLIDLAELVRRQVDLEVQENPDDRAQIERLWKSLSDGGVDVEARLAAVDRARAHQAEKISAVNEALDGETVKLAGYLLPLEQNARGKIGQFLLVPFIGACVHVPPPPPNQVVYVDPSAPVEDIGLFAKVWVEGIVRRDPSSHSIFRVDGYQQVDVSYSIEMTEIEAISRVELSESAARGENILTMPSALDEMEVSWWEKLQLQISVLFANTMADIASGQSASALFFGLAVCFGYGVLHTLGPGHGKAVIISYFVGSGGSLKRGLSMGVRIALCHVTSAMAIVLAMDVILRQVFDTSPANYPVVRLFSYGSIAAIGAWMLWQALRPPELVMEEEEPPSREAKAEMANALLYSSLSDRISTSSLSSKRSIAPALAERPNTKPQTKTKTVHWQHANACSCLACDDGEASGNLLAVAIGSVPCSGALTILLYGLANDTIWTSILLVVAISVGMAMTLAAIGIAAIWGRNLASRRFQRLQQDESRFAAIGQKFRVAGAGVVCAIGVVLFGATLMAGISS